MYLPLHALCCCGGRGMAISVVCEKGNFPLAECNEISGKCFSRTPLGAWV